MIETRPAPELPGLSDSERGGGSVRRFVGRLGLWASLVWRPATGDRGDSWLAAWIKYRITPGTAWDVAKTLIP